MRLAIFSDLHGQVERLTACLDAIARIGADELWCLGDAIDVLPARPPELTVACVRAINDVCAVKLAGNHEAWALQDRSLPNAAAELVYRPHIDLSLAVTAGAATEGRSSVPLRLMDWKRVAGGPG